MLLMLVKFTNNNASIKEIMHYGIYTDCCKEPFQISMHLNISESVLILSQLLPSLFASTAFEFLPLSFQSFFYVFFLLVLFLLFLYYAVLLHNWCCQFSGI